MQDSLVFALMRHGDYEQPAGIPSALLPYPLTSLGRDQADQAVAGLLAFAKANQLTLIKSIDSSQQLRAWQTAQIVAEGLAANGRFVVEEYRQLSERSVGALANLTVTEIEQVMEADPRYSSPPAGWKADSHFCLPFQGAESLMQAGQRVADHIRATEKNLAVVADKQLKIIVGHGASIRHACVHLGILKLDDVAKISMHHATPIYITCRDGIWRHIGGEWKQRSAGSTGDEIRES